ncbi:MAG TPA: hypothetical protein VLF18_18710 [Tahibacter sp.]|nr:hypothetical protein [Tahibacter sp.]
MRAYAEENDIADYVAMRWITCGWAATVPALDTVAQITRADAVEETDSGDARELLEADALVEALAMTISANPAALTAGFVEEYADDPDADEPSVLAKLMRVRVSVAQMERHLRQGRESAAAWLRARYVLTSEIDGQIEIAFIAERARGGDIDGARMRLAAAEPRFVLPGLSDERSADRWKALRETLDEPVATSSAATGPGIVIDRSTVGPIRRICGTSLWNAQLFGFDDVRERVLRAAPIDTALAELLQDWHEPTGRGGGDHPDLLVELLRKRHGAVGTTQGIDDAIASIRNDEHVAGMNLFGQFVALPSHVREDDPSTTSGVRERRLEIAELAAIVRDTRLFRTLRGSGR